MKKLSTSEIIHVVMTCSLLLAVVLPNGNRIAISGLPEQQKNAGEQEPLKLNATLVQAPTIVTDRAGKFVSDLSQNDFTLYENGKRQEIALFAAEKQPFNAVLVLDTSNSAQDRLRVIQSAAVSFTKEIGEGDQMMVISFDNEVRQLTDFTTDKEELRETIEGTESGFGKLLYEAVARALSKLRDVEGRRAVILFSDGVDMRSIDETAESTIRMAEEIGAVIYVVRFDTRWWIETEARRQKAENPESNLPFSIDGRIPLPPDFGGPDPNPSGAPGPRRPRIEITTGGGMPRAARRDPVTENLDRIYGEADEFIDKLSSSTGGRVFPAENFDGTQSAFRAIAEELRNQYVIGYYPSNEKRDGKYRKIKIEVNRKDAKVRARPGYRLESSEQ